ncbi:MAG: hypothetical protein JNL69_13430 [Bacteroidia bacterium]|nr:hypothetical protein [Bacteroidia bacterium]
MNKSTIIILVVLVCVFLGAGLYFTNEKLKEERQKRKEAEQANVRLIMDSIRKQKGFSEVVKDELKQLGQQFEAIEPDVTAKIAKAIQLIEINQTENAIEDLAVIMENLLNDYYSKDNAFNAWLKNRRADLHNLLSYCKEDKKINDVELQFFLGVKTIRNKEDHTLNLKLDEYLNATGLIVGIGAIVKIASFWKTKKVNQHLVIA